MTGSDELVSEGATDFVADGVALLIPGVPAGLSKIRKARKLAKAEKHKARGLNKTKEVTPEVEKASQDIVSSSTGKKIDSKTGQPLGPSEKPAVHTVKKSSIKII